MCQSTLTQVLQRQCNSLVGQTNDFEIFIYNNLSGAIGSIIKEEEGLSFMES